MIRLLALLSLAGCLQAALVTRYVNTASTAGGDGTTNATSGATRAFASLNEAETVMQQDLVAAGDSLEIICEGAATADSASVAISGWTTGASNTLTIKATTGKHTGTPGSGYRLTSTDGGGTLRIGEEYVIIDGLEISNSTTNGAIAFNSALGASNSITIKNCLIWNSASSSSGYTIVATQANLVLTFDNNVVWGGSRSWDTRGATTVTARYNTFWRHADQLGLVSGSELALKNSYSGKASGSSEDFWSGGSPTGDHNASSDTTATARYTSSQNSKAGSSQFTSITSGSENFSLKSGNGLDGLAATVGGLTTDILGTTRDGSTPDIGAFEFVTGGGGGTPMRRPPLIFH